MPISDIFDCYSTNIVVIRNTKELDRKKKHEFITTQNNYV